MHKINLHGIVLCAGFGTRLRPLTTALPKPAIPIGPVPAALRNIEQLLAAGIRVVHCNTHYLAQELEAELLAACHSRGISDECLKFWNEPEILETGGGIAQIIHSLAKEDESTAQNDALVVSGDIVADIPLKAMLEAWNKRAPQQTSLMVSLPLDKPRKDVTWVDLSENVICGFGADLEPSVAAQRGLTPRVFSNHQIISAGVLQRAHIEKKSSIDLFYRDSLTRGEKIIHVPFAANAAWFDVGTPEAYLRCISTLENSFSEPSNLHHSDVLICHSKSAWPDEQAQLPDLDQASALPAHSDQVCLSKPDHDYKNFEWRWLGHLHSHPTSLLDGLARLLETFTSDSRLNAPQPDSFSSPLYTLSSLGGLSRLSSPSPLPASISNSRWAGFIEVSLPSQFHSHPLCSSPLLVSLDLLLLHSAEAQTTLNIFWILFTPPRQ